MIEDDTAFGIISWEIVDDMVRELSKISAQIARVDLGSLPERIASEKRKLKSLCTKHSQACEEVGKARRSAQREKSVLVELHAKLEQDLATINDEDADHVSKRNVINVEIAQVRKKLETKRTQHEQFLSTHIQAMKKRERMIHVQGKTVRNLLHRKLALGEIALAGSGFRTVDNRPEDVVVPNFTNKKSSRHRAEVAVSMHKEAAEIESELGITGQAPIGSPHRSKPQPAKPTIKSGRSVSKKTKKKKVKVVM